MATPKTTSQITYGNWTIIQMSLTGAQFTDAAMVADPSGAGTGPQLVHDRSIWKYPLHTVGGRIEIPSTLSRPLRLTNIMANFGASATWALHVAGFDNTAQRPDNDSGEPYDSGDAASYREGDIIVDGGTDQYLAKNLDPADAGTGVLILPGQHVYLTTTGATNPLARLTFSLAVPHV